MAMANQGLCNQIKAFVQRPPFVRPCESWGICMYIYIYVYIYICIYIYVYIYIWKIYGVYDKFTDQYWKYIGLDL